MGFELVYECTPFDGLMTSVGINRTMFTIADPNMVIQFPDAPALHDKFFISKKVMSAEYLIAEGGNSLLEQDICSSSGRMSIICLFFICSSAYFVFQQFVCLLFEVIPQLDPDSGLIY